MARIQREMKASRQQRAAVLFLKAALANGPRLVSEIEQEAQHAGIGMGSLRWAKSYCQVGHSRENTWQGKVWWKPTAYTERVEVPHTEQRRREVRLVELLRFITSRVEHDRAVSISDLMNDWRKANPRLAGDTPTAVLVRQKVKQDFSYLLRSAYQPSGDVQYYADAQAQWRELDAEQPSDNDPTALIEWANRLARLERGIGRSAQYARSVAEEVCEAQKVKLVSTPDGLLVINE